MLIAGIDEAGRGPCVGPLCMAVVSIEKKEEEKLIELGVKDSKLLAPNVRKSMFASIKNIAFEVKSLQVEALELDELMLRRSLNEIEAMKVGSLLNAMERKPDVVYIDSPDPIESQFTKRVLKYVNYSPKIISKHKADMLYPVVSAASIIAKVERDNAIDELKKIFGELGSGYSHDERTIAFVKTYTAKNKCLPDCVRKRWDTSRRILDNEFQQKLF